ncbi:MAG: hypothetical protein PVI57_15640 [Gemmatimonadota bacterium]|jgi:hypothetical protein
MDRDEDGLRPEERAWLERVPEQAEPPPGLRDKVVGALSDEGEIGPAARRAEPGGVGRARILRVAAGLVLALLVGGVAGRVSAPSPGPPGEPTEAGPAESVAAAGETAPRFVLLLYEDGAYSAPGRTPAQLVGEYTDWARALEEEGILELAEKLSDDARVVPTPGSGGPGGAMLVPATSSLVTGRLGALTGFFVVRAASYDEAARIARESPHAGYGGRVVVRRIDPT